MPINFPNSPSPNQLYTYDDKTWEWNGIYWEVYSALTSYVTSTTFNYYTGTTQPLILNAVTGGSYSSGTLYLVNNSGTVIPISGFSTSGGSSTVSGDYLPLSGGTVTGGTIFTSGLTANTISATTYLNLPKDIFVTGGTYNGSQITFTNNSGGTFNVTGLTASGFSANYYGSFSDSTNQPVSGANIATVWRYNTTELSNGITVVDNTKITVANTGVYEIGYSPQIEKTQGAGAIVTIWAAINGNPVARSSSTLGLVSNSVLQLPFVSFIFELNANDYVEFYFSSDNQYVQLTALSGLTTPTRPDSPSVIIVAKQVGLSSTAGATGDTFVTGFSLNNNTITLSQNRSDQYSAFTISLSAYTGTTGSSFTGGTVSGATNFTNGLSANTISATTYLNLPLDVFVTGGTYSGGTLSLINNSGNTLQITGFSSLQYFVTGSTPSGVTLNSGDRWFNTTTGEELVWINDGNSSQWLQICCGGGGGSVNNDYLSLSGGTVTGATNFTGGLTANTISATTYQNLPIVDELQSVLLSQVFS